MSQKQKSKRTKSQESRNAIEKLYISMRHLFTRGYYKPMGISGESLRKALLLLNPEIYGSIREDKIELKGLQYVIDRLPRGIEECQFINLTTNEGYDKTNFSVIIPAKRRRNCYRIDANQMNIEITRGRSEIYDILTHLTFLFIESHKIQKRITVVDKENFIREWIHLEDIVINNKFLSEQEEQVTVVYLSRILGRTYNEVFQSYIFFKTQNNPNRFFQLIYWLGKLATYEVLDDKKRTITFSNSLIDEIGHHIHGEIWANNIKKTLQDKELLKRPIHIISANMHSVMNTIYAKDALPEKAKENTNNFQIFELLSNINNKPLRLKVKEFAAKNGLIYLQDKSGTNINVQIIDTFKINFNTRLLKKDKYPLAKDYPVLIVMDYAFGEQAYETMDELLKPFKKQKLNITSISIMGKAGILKGKRGDIMVPSSHIFEGTADNYPFKNCLKKEDLEGFGVDVYKGSMISVLGTSLQNKELLKFFHNSTWNAIGLEMEGAHYQKAIQAASKIRNTIDKKVKVRYAYYASDNPIETGATLASGGLGMTGVTPTYAITQKILEQIFE